MSGNVVIVILAIAAALSLGFSIAAFVIQLKRNKKADKSPGAQDRDKVKYEPISMPVQQPGYSQQNVQPQQMKHPFEHDDYGEKTQSLWSSSNRPPASGAFGAHVPARNCYKIYINESSPHGEKMYELEVTGDMTVGRAETNGLVISDTTVSGLQCVLSAKPEGLYIENRSGSNITRLNGVALVGTNLLNPNNTISIGKVNLTILDIQKTI